MVFVDIFGVWVGWILYYYVVVFVLDFVVDVGK